MHRVVIFTHEASGIPAILIRSTVAALASRPDIALAAICVPERPAFATRCCRPLLRRARARLQALYAPVGKRRHHEPSPIPLNRWARRFRFKVLVPPAGNINHPQFIERLRHELEPTIALSFFCLQKFSPELLAVFNHAVNYHNGFLPQYRGLKATAWSIYHGDRESGFAFHRMDARFDRGPILLQEAIPVTPDRSESDHEMDKAVAAAAHIPRVLRMAMNGDPGIPQQGNRRYFSWNDYLAATRIADPSVLSSTELEQRLRAFGCLRIQIAGCWQPVTSVRPLPDAHGKSGRFCFRASDGVLLEPVRFEHLPYAVYRTLRWCARRLPGRIRP